MSTRFGAWALWLIFSLSFSGRLLSASNPEQTEGAKAPQTAPSEHHIAWERYFYASPNAESAARKDLYARLKQFHQYKGHVGESGQLLLRALADRDKITQDFIKHDAYLYLRYAVNNRDKISQQDMARLEADFAEQTAFLESEILGIPSDRIKTYLAGTPGLTKFGFEIEKVQRSRSHTRPLREEELLRGLSPELTDWPSMLFEQLGSETKFEPVTVKGENLDPQRDRRKLAMNPDPKVRQEAFSKRDAGFERMAPLYAFTLARLVAVNNRLGSLHAFKNAPEEAYWRSFLSRAEVNQLLSSVAGNAEIYKSYELVRAKHVERALGMKQANIWDLDAATSTALPKFNYDEMQTILSHALAPLGEEYVREMNALLEPANGRVDVASGPNRKRSGFSKGFPGFSSVFFAGDYTGSYNDMRVIAHEGGHAVHRELMTKAGVIPAYAEGPHFLFESFAVLNELLLADYLSAEAKSPEQKAWYLEQFLEGKGTVAFVAGAEAELEQRIYEEGQSGKTIDANSLDTLTASVYAKYSRYGQSVPEIRHRWMMIPLMYEDPFYDLNYVYAGVLGLKYYEMLEKDPVGFRKAYMSLLKNGFNAPPRELLRKYLAISLDDPALVDGAMKMVAARVEKLRLMYEQEAGVH